MNPFLCKMSRTSTFSRRPWRHTGKFNRKKESMVNTDTDMVNADEDIVNTDKEKILHARDSQDREQTVRRESENTIREIVDEVVSGVVEKESNIIEDPGQQRCYKIFNQVVKRRRIKNLINLQPMKERNLNLMLLDIIIVRLDILNINQKIKEIEEMIRKKVEPRKKEIAVVETDTKDKEPKKAVAVVKPNQKIMEHMPVLPEQNINEENYEIDDANEAQINYHDLAPTEYPWREIKEDLGKSSDSDDTVPDLYPDSPPSLTSNDRSDSEDSEEVQIIRHIRSSSHGSNNEEILNSEANQDDDDDIETQTRTPTPAPIITINGRQYAQRTLMAKSRSGESAMYRMERRAMDPSPEADRVDHSHEADRTDNVSWLLDSPPEEDRNNDSEEGSVIEQAHANRFRDWERRGRRNRYSSSESEAEKEDRIRHRSRFNPNLQTIRIPDVGGVEELNEFTRHMFAMEEVGGNSDELTDKSHRCRGKSCHCSSSEILFESDDMA